MKSRFIVFVIGLLVIQAALLIFLRNSPELKLERSFTPTPTITPLPLPPTAVPPTRIPTLIPATMVAPTRQGSQLNSGAALAQPPGSSPANSPGQSSVA